MPAFTIMEMVGELRQAEIITGLSQSSYDPVSEEGIRTPRPYTILLTQDCDLLRDFQARADGKPRELNGILFYEAEPTELRSRLAGGDFLRRINRHSEERYHLLPAVPPELDLLGQGLPELIVDFRRYFTLAAGEIYRQCAIEGQEGAKRRCRLEMPYREHLQNRAAYYFQRVGLPTE